MQRVINVRRSRVIQSLKVFKSNLKDHMCNVNLTTMTNNRYIKENDLWSSNENNYARS